MALTKPRAYQIYDIDYKQAVRVVSTTNITLSGGAPNSVDGVTLNQNDRVLVTGQTGKAQNGIYYVTTVGTGSNGVWARSVDANTTGEVLAGMIVMVTEGSQYSDTQWKLLTDDPIVIGTTELTFAQNFGVPYTAATVPPTANVVVGSQWFNTSTNVLYEYMYDGTSYYWIDITGPAIGTNGAQAGTYLANGNSNVAINDSNGAVTIGVTGTSNVVTISNTALNLTGNITLSGIVTSNGNVRATAFAVGNGAVSNVALGYFPTAGTPAEMAVRDYSTVASTMYFDNSVGSANVQGSFQFRGSNAFTQWAKIDQYGINLPTRPAFRVYGNTSTNFTTGTTLTNQVIDYNQGNYYVNSTGIFTAPVAGLYSVWLNARAGSTASLSQIGVFKNNDTSGSNVVCFWEITTSATTTTHFGVSSVTKLAAGDTLRAKVVAGGVNFDNNDNWGAAYIG